MRHASAVVALLLASLMLAATVFWNINELWHEPSVVAQLERSDTRICKVFLQSERTASLQEGTQNDTFFFKLPNGSASEEVMRLSEVSCDCVEVLLNDKAASIGDSVRVPAGADLAVTLRPPVSNRLGINEESVVISVGDESERVILVVESRVVPDIALNAACLEMPSEVRALSQLSFEFRQRYGKQRAKAIEIKCTELPRGVVAQADLGSARTAEGGLTEESGVLKFEITEGFAGPSRTYPNIEVWSANGVVAERRFCLIVGGEGVDAGKGIDSNAAASN